MSAFALREKFPYLQFLWSVFSRIGTEYGPENSEYGHFLRSVDIIISNTNKVGQTNRIKHEKSCTKCDGEASPRPKNKIERIYGLAVCYYVLLFFLTDYSVLLCPSRGP